MTEQYPDRLPEDFRRSRREHPGKLERLDDDQLARLAGTPIGLRYAWRPATVDVTFTSTGV